MDKIVITMGDFLKNAGIVGLNYLLDRSNAREDLDYGITSDDTGSEQCLWLSREFAVSADWTDLYFKAFIEYYGSGTAYQAILERMDKLLDMLESEKWLPEKAKEDLKFIQDKLLSNSNKSGVENIRGRIENPQVYEQLKANKLKETIEPSELQHRLYELKAFLMQPLCAETFQMKGIIYNYINRFWSGKSFLLTANAKKDMRICFETDFSEKLRQYLQKDHAKSKEMCVDCSNLMDSGEKVSIAFMTEQADDLARKTSSYWKGKVDLFLCPVCAFVYSLVPLGFQLIGNRFLFINANDSLKQLLHTNSKEILPTKRKEEENYSTWIARTMIILLEKKTKELRNIQIIIRGKDADDRYIFGILGKDVLELLSDSHSDGKSGVRADLKRLSEHPYMKLGKEFYNIYEAVVMNIIKYRNQYGLLDRILKLSMDQKALRLQAGIVYDIQLRTSLRFRCQKEERGGIWVSRYSMRESGYELRGALLRAKGTTDDSCLRGTVYQLLNALSVRNVERFMEILMRVYCSNKLKNSKGANLEVPDGFIHMLDKQNNHASFLENGYAFILGLQGSHKYEKGGEGQ